MLKTTYQKFERLAFESAVREHPGDVTAQLAFADFLHDHGYTMIGAKREVTKIVREVIEQRDYDRLLAWRNRSSENMLRINDVVYRRVRQHVMLPAYIHIVAGHRPIVWTVEPDWAENQATGDRYVGSLPVPLPIGFTFHRGDVNVTVGATYLIRLLFPKSKGDNWWRIV